MMVPTYVSTSLWNATIIFRHRTTIASNSMRRCGFTTTAKVTTGSQQRFGKIVLRQTNDLPSFRHCDHRAALVLPGSFLQFYNYAYNYNTAIRTTTTISRSGLTMNTNHLQFHHYKSGGMNRSSTTATKLFLLSSYSSSLAIPSMSSLTSVGSVSYMSSMGRGGGPNRGWSVFTSGIGMLGGASVLFGKTKYLIAALKLTKFASLGSMILSIGTYSMFFGFPYAIGIVGLTLVHEIGHAIVMYRLNIPFSPMVFVPFMGAVIAMKDHPRDAYEDALVAFGGPVLGSLGAGAVAFTATSTNSQLLYALADFGYMVNLFNLLPIGSMDGGRISGAISKWVGVGGLGIGGMLAYHGVVQNPLFYLILLSGGYQTFQRFYDPYSTLPPNYYRISTTQRIGITGGYIGLITCLLVAQGYNERYKKSPERLMDEHKEKSWDYTT